MPDPAVLARTEQLDDARRGQVPSRGALLTAALVAGLVLVAQIPIAIGLLNPDALFEAGHASSVLLVNALLAAVTVVAAALLPVRQRALAIVPGALVASAMLGASVTVGGHLWDVAMALLTVTAGWWIGRMVLRGLAAERLQGVVLIELTIGFAGLGLVVLLLGRLGILAWWSAGALTIAVGALGAWSAVRAGWERRGPAWEALAGSRIGAACAGLLLLQLGWALVWLSAPEIMYDALYAKAYLPQLWAQTGSIGPLLVHPVLNVTGLMQIVAAPGHAVGAPNVGRDLQAIAWVLLVGTTWWWAGRRSAIGPLAALAVGVVPHLVWQTATADDDLMLAAGAMALAIAVLGAGEGGLGIAIAIGLLAGACFWLKLSLVVIVAVLVVGWLVAAGPDGRWRRVGGVALGAAVVAAPALVLRWIDTGNPLFPAYNEVFHSTHYPAVNEQYNFPFWPHPGVEGTLKAVVLAVTHPSLMNEVAPPGAFGLLIAAVVLAVLVGWRRGERRATLVVWLAVVVSALAWWVQFRYLRYLLPTAMVAVVLVLVQLRGWRPGRRATTIALVAAGLASACYLPSTVANFWNVPHRTLPFAAAFGRWKSENYLRTVFPEKDVLAAYQRLAPPGSDAVTVAHERTFVHGRDLSPAWEVSRLLEISGALPSTPDATLRGLRALRVGWAIVAGPDAAAGLGAPQLLTRHGQLVFADRGWELYRLVDAPAQPRLLPACDDDLRAGGHCWSGTLDATPGLADGESSGGVTRNVPVCPGETVAVQLTTVGGAQPAFVTLNADGGDAFAGHTSGTVSPGTTGWVYGTAPPKTHTVGVGVVPGAGGGAIVHVRVGLLGHCAAGAP